MRKYLLLPALVLPCFLAAQEVPDRTWFQLNEALTLWAPSSNAAGLAVSPYKEFNTLSAMYDWEAGDWRPMQTGTEVGALEFDTQGAKQIGRIQLWGRFKYDNINDKGSSFNTLLYDPFDERFLYTAADTVAGQWKKQSYEMQFKAAMPLGQHWAAGVHVKYTDRIAAGQIDPRAESYHYSVVVKPGAVWTGGHSRIGINGLYSNTFERSTPSISNSQEIQKVYLLRGLGNWVGEQVGGGGLSTMYFRCNTWGGALQYAYEGSWTAFAELSFANHSTRITESATQPKPHGSTRQLESGLNAAAVLGNGPVVNKLSLAIADVRTFGTEPTALWNTSTGRWEVQSELEQCRFSTSTLDLDYDRYVRDGDGYKWHLYGSMGLTAVHYSYATPFSEFQYGNISATVGAEYRFRIGSGTLLAGSSVKGVKDLGGSRYEYNGHRAGTAPVRDLYPHNLAVWASDRVRGSLSAEYRFTIGKATGLALCAECSGIAAWCGEPGTLRRVTATGAVRLYF